MIGAVYVVALIERSRDASAMTTTFPAYVSVVSCAGVRGSRLGWARTARRAVQAELKARWSRMWARANSAWLGHPEVMAKWIRRALVRT